MNDRNSTRRLWRAAAVAALVLLLAGLLPATGAAGPWTRLESGLEVALFDAESRDASDDGDLVVLRLDPELWQLRLYAAADQDDDRPRTIRQWCREFGLTAAINGGMYQADRRTHVGFSQVDGRITNPAVNDYLSVLACDPLDPTDPPFGLFDLDTVTLPDLAARYRTVLQNLRLVKRERENRWQPSTERWIESAAGEDTRGRILLIHCRTPLSMFDFNELLLDLPLDLVAAQHLEGNTPARFWIEHATWQALALDDDEDGSPKLPLVLGATRRRTAD